ncbi:hypothetical protein HAX54_020843 [Datura stramonium]|uniref:Uncharacterized protein n=1 Tax=Datura stramonium TaxID=4076 RepID=A0ABS8UTT3_DATST|nr:hypothetical protein [Datura stramonium]
MTDSGASGQAGLGIVTIPSDEPETSGGENATLHDEHIAYIMQQIDNMQNIPQRPLVQTTPFTQNHQTNQHIPATHIAIPSTQYVPPVYVAAPQPFTTPIPTMPHLEVDPYEEMEREAGPKNDFEPGRGLGVNLDGTTELIQLPDQKYTFGLGYEPTPKEISLASLKRKGDILLPKPIPSLDQSFSKTFVSQVLDEVDEDNLVEGLKNLFLAEEEAECNMILKDSLRPPPYGMLSQEML